VTALNTTSQTSLMHFKVLSSWKFLMKLNISYWSINYSSLTFYQLKVILKTVTLWVQHGS